MQGLWTNHRKSKLNLNSTLVTPPSEEVPPASELPAATSSLALVVEADGISSPSGSKRKLKSTRSVNGAEGSSKRHKPSLKDHSAPQTRLSDLGGIEPCVEKMLELIALPLCHPEVYLHTGVNPPRGVLLHGPPGCGKTLLANAIAGVSRMS